MSQRAITTRSHNGVMRMIRRVRRSMLASFAVVAAFGLIASSARLSGQSGLPSTRNGEWTHYTADVRGSRYSPLDQINASNFNQLEVAWRFKTDNLGTRPEFKLEGTPLMVKGVIYATGGTRRSVVALDGKSGELIWVHAEKEGARAVNAPRQLSGRGLSYWTDGKGDERVIYVTTGYRLVSLNAKTGVPVPSFGENGVVDMKKGAVIGKGEQINLETGEIGLHSTPTVAKDVVIVGSSFREGLTVKSHNNTKGLVRAWDVRSGKLLWTFNTIPRPGEFGNDTWEKESWAINGNRVKAVAQATKQGFLFVFDRVTGKPIWPIEERPVPQTDVPDEKTSPTQPFPSKPPAYSRNGVLESDLVDFTPEIKAQALEVAKRYRLGPVYLPPLVSKPEGPIAALTAGTLSGGVNWPGSAYDPEMHVFFTHACNSCIAPLGLVAPPKEFSDLDYVMGTAGQTFRPIVGGGEGEAADAPRQQSPARGAAPPAAPTPPPPTPPPAGASAAPGGGRGG